jgi:protein-disulfide isomerase
VLHQLAPTYIDTGKAKVVFRQFAFIGDESQWAAQASECANAQNKFWVFADYVFSHQAGENKGAFSIDNLKGFAKQVGLDTNAFNACLDSGKYQAVVQQETTEGQQRGVRATPTFFVNGQRLEGLLPVNQFASMIDSLQPH